MDEAKREAFAERMVQVVNDAGLALLCSIGHRTGLFDAMAELEPATSAGIAQASGLNERYVREWLAGVTVGGIVEYDRSEGGSASPRNTRRSSREGLGRTIWHSRGST